MLESGHTHRKGGTVNGQIDVVIRSSDELCRQAFLFGVAYGALAGVVVGVVLSLLAELWRNR